MPVRAQKLAEFICGHLVIRDAARLASEALGVPIRCTRADDIAKPGKITEQIMEAISDADLLIADLSGNNPNVMYELGYGHALGKPAIIINQDVHSSPFDVKHFRQVLYDRSKLVRDCRPSLVAAMRDALGDEQHDGWEPAQTADDRQVPRADVEAVSKGILRPGPNLVASLQAIEIKLSIAVTKNDGEKQREYASELLDVLARVTISSAQNQDDLDNAAAAVGNCAVELERGELLDEAEAVYRRGLGLFPDYAGLHLQYTDFLIDAGRHDEARQELRRVRELRRDHDDQGRLERQELKLSIATGTPDPGIGSKLRAEFEKDASNRERALAYLTYLRELGGAPGDFEAACDRWRKALPEDRKWQADRTLADYLATRKEDTSTERAIEVYEQLVALTDQGDVDRAAAFHNLAQLYDRKGNRQLAEARFREAYRLHPGDPSIRAIFSQRLMRWGKVDSAMTVIEGKPLGEAEGERPDKHHGQRGLEPPNKSVQPTARSARGG